MQDMPSTNQQQARANAIRFLAADAVEHAQSGHPGMPMGMALAGDILWQNHLKHSPLNPEWINRDRFVLSNGHGSMLLYALLHLTGYPISLDDLKQFRTLHSRTPGHPEYDLATGVETTTGPLGQGFAMACGMAIAEQHLSHTVNNKQYPIIDHHTYVFMGDGCMMEGISHEAASLAGTLKLGKLIAVWDDNGISIDGNTTPWFCEDVVARYKAYGWEVIESVDGNDPVAIDKAFYQAKENNQKPTLINLKTIIGFGAPSHEGSAQCHGAPLGNAALKQMREKLNWPHAPFHIPDDIKQNACCKKQGQQQEHAWQKIHDAWAAEHPDKANRLKRQLCKTSPPSFKTAWPNFLEATRHHKTPEATRKSSGAVIAFLAEHWPELFGGSADLTESNNTAWPNAPIFSATNPKGRYLHYGVREFGMFAMLNGITLHHGLVAYGGTFLTFADYGKNALRLAALMRIPSLFIFSHDSIGLGEDGPTHQPIEHLAMLRAIPNLNVWRPADRFETLIAWQQIIAEENTPSCLILSRQSCRQQDHTTTSPESVSKGAYLLLDSPKKPSIILLATGSEVGLATAAAKALGTENINASVLSIPCMDRFKQLNKTEQNTLLPDTLPRVCIEAGHPMSWFGLARPNDLVIGISTFGDSAPGNDALKAHGFGEQEVIHSIKTWWAAHPTQPNTA
jgi:transketolase